MGILITDLLYKSSKGFILLVINLEDFVFISCLFLIKKSTLIKDGSFKKNLFRSFLTSFFTRKKKFQKSNSHQRMSKENLKIFLYNSEADLN